MTLAMVSRTEKNMSRNTLARAYVAQAKQLDSETLCVMVMDIVDGEDAASIAVRMYVQELADRLILANRQVA